MVRKFQLHPVFAAILGGSLIGSGSMMSGLWPLALLGIALLLVAVLDRSITPKRAFLCAWLAGAIIYGCAFYGTFWHALPLSWLGAGETKLHTVFVATSWFTLIGAMGLAVGAWGYFIRKFATDTWRDHALIPAAWVLSEALAVVISNIVHFGSGTLLLSLDATIGMAGYLLASDAVVLQLARIGGVFALSGAAAAGGTLLYRLVCSQSKRERKALAGVAIGGVLLLAGAHAALPHVVLQDTSQPGSSRSHTASFAVLSTDLSGPYVLEKNLSIQQELVELAGDADVVVLPEASEYFLKLWQVDMPYPTEAGVYVDSSEWVGEDGLLRTRAEFFTSETGGASFGMKRFLMPFGEYMPYSYLFASRLLGFDDSLSFSQLLKHRQHSPGGIPSPVETPSGALLGHLFCNEVLSPSLYQGLVRSGANVLTNSASHMWFNDSRTVYSQIKRVAQVRAAENNRFLVQANNAAPAFVIDNFGRVVAETPWDSRGALIQQEIPLIEKETIYTKLGLSVLLVPLIVVLWILRKRSRA